MKDKYIFISSSYSRAKREENLVFCETCGMGLSVVIMMHDDHDFLPKLKALLCMTDELNEILQYSCLPASKYT